MEREQINHLPEEITIEILSKLPVKSFLRFKCICKSWHSLISTKHFIKTYLKNSKNNDTLDDSTMIIAAPSRVSGSRGGVKACSLFSLLTEPVTRGLPLDFPINPSRDLLIVGSCNGLVCILMVKECRFFLWNPKKSECKELPDFFAGVDRTSRGQWFIGRHGFALDENSGDYKIYIVFRLILNSIPSAMSVARMYSFKADSWGEPMPVVDGSKFEAGKFASGKLHWRSDLRTKSKWKIVCLELKSVTFGTVEQPSCLYNYFSPGLGVLKGSLCLYFDYPHNMDVGFDIWIWKKYGVEDSWARLLTIPYESVSWGPSYSTLMHDDIIPLIVLPNDEVLFTIASDFFIYNPNDDWGRKLDTVDFDLKSARACEAHVYTESLVSLARRT